MVPTGKIPSQYAYSHLPLFREYAFGISIVKRLNDGCDLELLQTHGQSCREDYEFEVLPNEARDGFRLGGGQGHVHKGPSGLGMDKEQR